MPFKLQLYFIAKSMTDIMIMRCNDSQCVEIISQGGFYIFVWLLFSREISLISIISKYDSFILWTWTECRAMFVIFCNVFDKFSRGYVYFTGCIYLGVLIRYLVKILQEQKLGMLFQKLFHPNAMWWLLFAKKGFHATPPKMARISGLKRFLCLLTSQANSAFLGRCFCTG